MDALLTILMAGNGSLVQNHEYTLIGYAKNMMLFLVGIGTVLNDFPALDVRDISINNKRNPIK